jgi:hypothetical protein
MFKDIDQFLTILSIIFLHWTTPIILLSFLKWTFNIGFDSIIAYYCYSSTILIIIYSIVCKVLSEKKGEKIDKKWKDQIVILTGGNLLYLKMDSFF